MITLIGDNGIITKAQEAAFKEEMLAIKETVNLYNIVSQVGGETEINLVPLSISDIEDNNLKDTLKLEIAYWGNYDIEVNKLTEAFVKTGDNFKTIVTKRSDNVKDIYYIEGEENINRKYIYNKETDVIYKVATTRVGMHKVHGIEELDFKKAGSTIDKTVEAKNYTTISYASNNVTLTELGYYEPDLNNMAKETTSLIFYKVEEDEETVTVTDTIKEMSAAEWLLGGRKSEIIVDGETYMLYDYENQIWANIKVVTNDLESWWVWIPRYAYNESGTTTETDIKFVDINNKPIDGSELPSGYKVAGSFRNNQKKGIWMSKYEPSPTVVVEKQNIDTSHIDISGFDKQNTHMVFYKMADGKVAAETKTLTIEEWEAKGRPAEITSLFTKYKLYDYENNIWANIKVVTNNLENWWVWIPRYAYNESGTTTDTDVIFVDENNKPIDGSELPSGYTVAGSFRNNQKLGIWMSKYEPSPKEN